jgi:hypothetical protein
MLNKKLCALYCLLLLTAMSTVSNGQSPRFTGNKEAKPHTYILPDIDKVELLKLKKIGDLWDGSIEATKIVEGDEARRIASLWRTQRYLTYTASCHLPAYAIKFYSSGKVLVYASLCWDCDNIDFINPKLKDTQGFDGKGKKGQQLLEVLTRAFRKE